MSVYWESPGAVRRMDYHAICHNMRVKTFPDGSQDVLVCEAPIFHRTGWEETGREGKPKAVRKDTEHPEDGQDRAIRRAKAQVRDLALCTPFRWFVTLTLDASRVDRYDMAEITRHLNHWLDNQVRRRGLAYVLVPERHKDGAVHFHGFFNDALETVDSGTLTGIPGRKKPCKPRSMAQRAQWLEQGAHPVYNLPGWSWGYTTAIELYGAYSKAVGYVCKYIGKGQGPEGRPEKLGGRWYYSGGDLGRPEVDYGDMPLTEAASWEGAYRFTVEDARMGFVLVHITSKGGETFGAQPCASGPAFGHRGPVPQRGLLPQGHAAGLRGLSVQAGP